MIMSKFYPCVLFSLFILTFLQGAQAQERPMIAHHLGVLHSYVNQEQILSGEAVFEEPLWPPFVKTFSNVNIDEAPLQLEAMFSFFYVQEKGLSGRYFPMTVLLKEGQWKRVFPPPNTQVFLFGNIHQLHWDHMAYGNQEVFETDHSVWEAFRGGPSVVIESRPERAEKFLFLQGALTAQMPFDWRKESFSDRWNVFLVPDSKKIPVSEDSRRDPVIFWTIQNASGKRMKFREEGPVSLRYRSNEPIVHIEADASGNLFEQGEDLLKSSLIRTLRRRGYLEFESKAFVDWLVETYLRKPGRRVLYTLPQSWTEAHLSFVCGNWFEQNLLIFGLMEL